MTIDVRGKCAVFFPMHTEVQKQDGQIELKLICGGEQLIIATQNINTTPYLHSRYRSKDVVHIQQ